MKTVIITGGNSGLGFETAKLIAADDAWRVVLACRNDEKAAAARDAIIAETGNAKVETLHLDTASLDSVRACAHEAIARYGGAIDALVNNAGVSSAGAGVTDDGFERVFETNYLGHFMLTMMLHVYMTVGARIINISSDMHNPPMGLKWPGADAVAYPAEGDKHCYAYSKLAMLYFTYEHDRMLRLVGSGICVNAFNPGFMADTNFAGGAGKAREMVVKTTMPDRYGNLETSSKALADLVTDPSLAGVSGNYFDRSTTPAISSELSYNRPNATELRVKSLAWCGLDGSIY